MNIYISRRINIYVFFLIVILVYNFFISMMFNDNPLNFLQYFDWMSKVLGGDLHSCCIYAYSETLVESHPYPSFSYLFFIIINLLFGIKINDDFSI